jgi:hypothetical protein
VVVLAAAPPPEAVPVTGWVRTRGVHLLKPSACPDRRSAVRDAFGG